MSAAQTVNATFTAQTHGKLASCTFKATSNKVHKGKKGKHPKPPTVGLSAKCDQAVSARLTGSVTEQLPKKHGKKRTKVFALGTVQASLLAGVTKSLTLKFPSSALSALMHGRKESASFTLTVTNANGRRQFTVAIVALKL
jgi:hypothetical protein